MSITHEQAQKLIQSSMDQLLNPEQSMKLSAHLQDCRECKAYAREIKEVTKLLSPMMKRQWDAPPVPLSITALVRKSKKPQSTKYLTMRTVAVSLVVMALFFSAWQFVFSNPFLSSQPSSTIPPVPTPSRVTEQLISTQLTLQNCAQTSYTVQEHDTLASIAEQFSVPVRTLVELNQLESEAIHTAMELMVPVCPYTPTGTFHAVTFTTTLTPVLNFRTSTPGG